ncbi:hypothetical protein GCM10022280_09480 [Sphingomonas swuensis]|uniref:Uncharacterized protein n=1 Tax=Sphingomonas swuensis TaxID=977800 RepID=A0ABP7SLB4_9SPHN
MESRHLPPSGCGSYAPFIWLRLTTTFAVLLLVGCDRFYGVESRATLPAPVDVRCVNAALSGVEGVGSVQYWRTENRSTEILPRQRNSLIVAHAWLYGESGADVLEIMQGPDGWFFRNSRSRMGVAVPHDTMARFVPLMQKVNYALEMRCGLPVADLKAELVEMTKSR